MNSQPINALLQRLLALLTNFEFQDRFDESFNGINGVLYRTIRIYFYFWGIHDPL